jgi:hypothetical protein
MWKPSARNLGLCSLAFALMLSSACSDDEVMQDPPLDITGSYSVHFLKLSTPADDCTGFFWAEGDGLLLVGDTKVWMNFPSHNQCYGLEYSRSGDTITVVDAGGFGDPTCTVDFEETVTFEFFANGTVEGTVVSTEEADSGDCSSRNLPCRTVHQVTGTRCDGCYHC